MVSVYETHPKFINQVIQSSSNESNSGYFKKMSIQKWLDLKDDRLFNTSV